MRLLNMVELSGLEKRWPSIVVHADLTVDTGRFLTLLGPSGCGKSTVLKLIAGLEKPDAGTIFVDGRDITRLPPKDRGVGMVFQDYALFPHLCVADNIAYGLAVRGMPKRERRERAQTLLKSIGLSGFGDRWPDSLSGGERQRVALARTLAVEPALVLFDEPLSSLDAPLRRKLREDLRDQQKNLGFTAILVTHDLEEAMAVSDTIAVMDSGRVQPPLPPMELWDSPPTASIARFLGHGTVLDVERLFQTGGKIEAQTSAGTFPLSRTMVSDERNAIDTGKPAALALFLPEDAFVLQVSGLQDRRMEAVCLSTVFSGNRWVGKFDAKGTILRIALPQGFTPEVGTKLGFRVEPDRVRLVKNV
jgi:ABC-type Fe3+/spermidine/putrescine transport system ATPase subunit